MAQQIKKINGKHLPRCEAEDCKKRPAPEKRIWAGHEVIFCSEHQAQWDEVIQWALVGVYEEQDAA